MAKKIYILLFALVLFSCNQKNETRANTDLLYFDLKGFFEQEMVRLEKLNPTVDKTVSVNGTIENKKVKITNWKKELAIFINADINKASWRGSFNISKENNTDIYVSNNKKIPVKRVHIEKQGLKVSKIEIVISHTNILFQSQDTLSYYPDSLYEIKKQQKIKLLSEKKYKIIGKF